MGQRPGDKRDTEISRERVSEGKGTNGKYKGPGAGECLACIQEMARKLVTESVRGSIEGCRGELGKEKACLNRTQDTRKSKQIIGKCDYIFFLICIVKKASLNKIKG